jgi:hypothetical protein
MAIANCPAAGIGRTTAATQSKRDRYAPIPLREQNAEYALPAEEEFAVSERYRTISYALLRSRSSCLRCSTGATSHLDVSIYTRS